MRSRTKIAALLLFAALAAALGGCVRNARFDYSELNVRLKELAPEYRFDEAALMFADGVYYAFYSFSDTEDTLLTLKEDETGRLERITLTTAAPFSEDADDFYRFSVALAEIFIPDAQTESLTQATGLDAPAALREKKLMTYEQGFYRAALFGTDVSTTFLLEYG